MTEAFDEYDYLDRMDEADMADMHDEAQDLYDENKRLKQIVHDARDAEESDTLLHSPWRVGRKVSRNVYAYPGPEDPDYAGDGTIIGQFDTGQLAQNAVDSHNTWLMNILP